jgi:hypothetical protein
VTIPALTWPDASWVTISYLRSAIGALSTVTYPALTGMDVGRKLPDPMTVPFTRVGRVGGVISEVYDDARLMVESFAGTPDAAADNAAIVRDLMRLMVGSRSGFTVSRVIEVGGPAEIDDPQTGLPRYLSTYSVRFRANARA